VADTVSQVRRFTFARGNLNKVLALPLYVLGAAASALVTRRQRLWAFGSGSGVGEGSLALLQHVRAVDPKIRVVWLARNARDVADARALRIPVVLKSSWRGFRLTLRARVIVVTHGFGDANRYGTRGAFVVQLWHGIPFKHIQLDSGATFSVPILSRFGFVRSALRGAYARTSRGIGLVAAASPLSAARMRTAFGLPSERVAITGDPRDDVVVTGSTSAAKDRLASLIADSRAMTSRIMLYAPTWRDGEPDPAIPTAADWRALAVYLERVDALLIIRSHPHGVGDYSPGLAVSDRIRMLGSELANDITPLLPGIDVLITDYSSIAFDFALTGRPILYLAPDVAEYSATRGVYEPFRDFSGGAAVTSWNGLLGLLETSDRDPAAARSLLDHSEWLAHRVHAFRDGGNTARVYASILARLDSDTQSPPGQPLAVQSPTAASLTVESLTITADASPLLIADGGLGADHPVSVALQGQRQHLAGELIVDGDRWHAVVPLLASRWGGPALPPPSGRYLLRLEDAAGRRLDVRSTEFPVPAVLREKQFRASVSSSIDAVAVDFAAPLATDEIGAAHQKALLASYRSERGICDAVFFESYFGQNASSNPRGIDRALAALRPDVARYWSVADASVEVPDGAVAVIEGSAAWWQARASARVLVVNDWLRKRFAARPDQTVLQTWHGTPLKRIALDRPGTRLLAAVATHREKSRWDIMLAQNQFSADTFRSAYAFTGPIWQEGYPRDDILLTGDPAQIRARLGITPGTRVVLYAPTWRDDRPGKVDHLDAASFAQQLGEGYVTLIRGHSRTMQPGTDVVADRVIDVTGYPDISELYLVADALITDYSSVMFDFTVTGKPLFFFVPDLAHYRDDVRGFYFDLLAVAPGPVLDDASELVRQLRDGDPAQYTDQYAAWRARFNPRDDGHAGERVVRRLIAEGLL
jgi:CDP-glycerol glycerophosphotransferase (TagB/SpsB family)